MTLYVKVHASTVISDFDVYVFENKPKKSSAIAFSSTVSNNVANRYTRSTTGSSIVTFDTSADDAILSLMLESSIAILYEYCPSSPKKY